MQASTTDNGPIAVDLVVAAGLRYVGGEYLKSMRDNCSYVFFMNKKSCKDKHHL
jgi:hypothetical protein